VFCGREADPHLFTEEARMSDVAETADVLHDSANRLYWQGHDGVDQLAARLGMSRHAFYGSIRPVPAGADCTECGEEMVYANRARRAQAQAHCPGCGAEARVEARALEIVPVTPPPVPLARPRRRSMIRRMMRLYVRDLRRVQPERAALIGGAAAAGVAVALVGAEVLRNLERW
jgi:hypothetical protein